MKLSKSQMQYICEKIIRTLKEKDLIVFKTEESIVLQRMLGEFEKNIEDEIAIEKQVNKLLLQYRDQINNGTVSKNKMFSILKKKIAEEKRFIL